VVFLVSATATTTAAAEYCSCFVALGLSVW
jgi:hypothetical protein